jgi:hypothetical protein
MTIINDPDNLDRFQVAIDPVFKTISVRGSGGPVTGGAVESSTGSGISDGTFCDFTGGTKFQNVVAGDILAIVDDPGNDGGHIGHYVVQSVDAGDDILTLDRNVTASATSGVSYRVFKDGASSTTEPTLADGVTMQALYSFLKEEWRVNSLSASGEDLIKYTFPMVSITSEQFEVGGVSNSNWEFADDTGDGSLASESSRNLIRTGGWASINDAGQIIENYPSVVTLGTLETDSQVYYQLTSATTNPIDFVLTGPVNQSIRTLETIGGTTTDGLKTPVNEVSESVTFATSAPQMTFSSDMFAAGFVSGELIQIRGTASNNGLFTIESSGAGATTINVSEAVVAEGPIATKASPMTDNRDYLVLRVRTKGKTYAQSEIADIGVSQVNTIVNRFPLAEADDPAITDDDGILQGGITGGNDFQSTSSVETGTTADITASSPADGTFELEDSAATFQTNNLQVGDAVSISAATNSTNIGVYEVSSVTSETVVVLFDEPLRGAMTDETGAATYEAFSQVRSQERSDGSTADSGTGGQGTFTSLGADFVTDGVVAGDVLRIKSGNHQGFYKVVSVSDLNTLEVNTLGSNSGDAGITEDSEFGVDSIITFDVVQAGMNLQYKKVVGTPTAGGVDTFSGATFTDAAVDATYVKGGTVVISGTANNDGTYLITGVSGTTVTVVNASDPSTSPTFNAGDDGTGAATTEYGFVRKLGDFNYSFNWKLEGNGGDLGECFQYLQRELRRTTDIDLGDSLFRGDITDLLMTFASPNGTTLNLFIDNVDAGVKNNLTQQDLSGASRNFDFLVALKIALNNNIRNASTNKIVVFYSDFDEVGANGDEFGTTGAIIVQDSASADMVAEDATTAEVTFEYVHPGVGDDYVVTIVCIADTTGQYVQTSSTLTRTNEVTASLVAGLERNYSNPS